MHESDEIFLERFSKNRSTLSFSQANNGVFEEPVSTINRSGGSAELVLIRNIQKSGLGPIHDPEYIGKQIRSSHHEADFYQKRYQICQSGETWEVFDFMLQYIGVFKLTSCVNHKLEKRDYLVMENLLSGMKEPRVMDIKLGRFTADTNWRGKSRWAAWRNRRIDKLTNSIKEGYRMEGMDNPPSSLISKTVCIQEWKRTRRFLYQGLTAAEFLEFFFDFDDSSNSENESSVPCFWMSTVLHLDLIKQLCSLVRAIRKVKIPQKWVGSSLVVYFDKAKVSGNAESDSSDTMLRIKLLDWGRSELLTSVEFNKLSPTQRENRANFWWLYIDSLSRLLYEATRLYYVRYVQVISNLYYLDVFDHDLLNSDDFIGRFILVPDSSFDTNEYTDCQLLDAENNPVRDEHKRPSVLKVRLQRISTSAAEEEWWALKIQSGHCLPRKDVLGKNGCDAYVRFSNSAGASLGRSVVCHDTRDPIWNFSIPIPNFDRRLGFDKLRGSMFGIESKHVSEDILSHIFEDNSSESKAKFSQLF